MVNQKDSTNRSWMLTIPAESVSKEELEKKLASYTYIGQMEKGEKSDYLHWQIYIENKNMIRFSTLKKKFPKAHLEVRHSSKKACYDYVTKSKSAIPNSVVKNGDISIDETDSPKVSVEAAVGLMERGMRVSEVLVQYPSLWRSMAYLERAQAIIDENKHSMNKRDVRVEYIYGLPGTGKTSYIYNTHGFDEVYRVTNYSHPFDGYNGQDVLVLDEFYNSIALDSLLNVIDVWPFKMPARYNDRWAAYTKVYIISNRKLKDQFGHELYYESERANSFYRRISDSYEMVAGEKVLDNFWLDQQVPPAQRL
nr:replication-associated protein [Tick-associated circular DNA virus]